jgi:hypothetical protein
MSVYDLINPMNLRRAIKSTFTGDASELVAEMLQNPQRAGARNVQFTTVDEGFTYLDDGRGLRDIADFEAIVRLGDSGWEQQIQVGQRPMGLGMHSLLAHDEIEMAREADYGLMVWDGRSRGHATMFTTC